MNWDTNNLCKRIMGDIVILRTLFDCGFLKGNDVIRELPLLYFVARFNCSNYKEIIDLLIKNNADINSQYTWSYPVNEAIHYKNYDVAAYIYSKGGKYIEEEVDPNDLIKFKKELDKLN